MERTIDPLSTMDAKLWADEFMATKARLGDKEFDHAMMLAWFANAIMVGYDEGQRRKAADAQATIAALQARVDAHERAYQEGHPTPCTLGSYCPYCEIERRVAQLTQRTAELEAANKLLYRKNCALGRAETIINDLQAEFERVSGDLTETKEEVKCLNEEVLGMNEWGLEVEKLLLALPKVEGEITCSQQCDSAWRLHYWQVEAYGVADECIYRLSNLREAEAKAYAALLKHRQGMEG